MRETSHKGHKVCVRHGAAYALQTVPDDGKKLVKVLHVVAGLHVVASGGDVGVALGPCLRDTIEETGVGSEDVNARGQREDRDRVLYLEPKEPVLHGRRLFVDDLLVGRAVHQHHRPHVLPLGFSTLKNAEGKGAQFQLKWKP